MRRGMILAVVLSVLQAAERADAQSVQARISSQEAFVGETLTVQITLSNMTATVAPVPPATTDFEIEANPGNPTGRMQRVEIVNGRRTQSVDLTYVYYARPLQTGRLVLPPFSVTYRGLVYHTQQFPIRVNKDTSGDFLFCRVKAEVETAYVGQGVDLELKVWVRQYQQRGVGVLNAETMWSHSLRDVQATTVGVFDRVDWDRPHYYETTRETEEGIPAKYYVYTLETTVYPKKPGPFDFGGVAVAYRYPKRLGRDDFFFSRWTIKEARRLRAAAQNPRLEIKPIPTAGRPPGFNGAIGPHAITAQARPVEAPVGDPITLTLAISGDGPLEQLRPPKLEEVEALKRDFEVSGESLAGEIRGHRKLFSQTIRALREDVTRIPPIPFSYFDPDTGRFETSHSEPIPLKVKPAERLALSTLSEPGAGAAVLVPLVESTEGLLANETDPDALLADPSGAIVPWAVALLAGMPAVYLLTWFVQRQAARLRDDEALRRRSQARATAKKTLRSARTRTRTTGSLPAGDVRNALIGYIADRCNVPPGGLTRADAVKLIANRDMPPATVQAVDALLASLEQSQYGGASGSALEDGAARVERLVDALERCKLR